MSEPVWTTLNGEKIPFSKLTDNHLKNIINDGYRGINIETEANKRGFDIPKRPVDKLSYSDIGLYLESFASCAIEGNRLGKVMCDLWEKDKNLFFFYLNSYIKHENSYK